MHMWHLAAFVGDRTLGPIYGVYNCWKESLVQEQTSYSRGQEYLAEQADDEAWDALGNRDLQGHLTDSQSGGKGKLDLPKGKVKGKGKGKNEVLPIEDGSIHQEIEEEGLAKALAKAKVARNHVASAIQDLEHAMKMVIKSKRMSAGSKKDAEDALKNGQQQLAILNTSLQTKTGSGEEIQSVIKAAASAIKLVRAEAKELKALEAEAAAPCQKESWLDPPCQKVSCC